MIAWRAAITRTVAAGIAAGVFDRTIDPDAAGVLIASAITGALFARVEPDAMQKISQTLGDWLRP